MSCGTCATQTAKGAAKATGAPVATGGASAEALAAFQAKYGLTFTRETFTQSQPDADGKFVLKPDNNDPLPPIGCRIKVYGYGRDKVWRTSVIAVDQDAGTYTARMLGFSEE